MKKLILVLLGISVALLVSVSCSGLLDPGKKADDTSEEPADEDQGDTENTLELESLEISVAADDGAAIIEFTLPDTAESVVVYVHSSIQVTKENHLKKVDADSSPLRIGDLENGVIYYFAASVVYPEGESELSSVRSCRPSTESSSTPPPENLQATVENAEVTVTYDEVPEADMYQAYMHTGSNISTENYTEKRTLSATSIVWAGLNKNIDYYFSVRTDTGLGFGSLAEPVHVQVPVDFSETFSEHRPVDLEGSQNHFGTKLSGGEGVLLATANRSGDGKAYIYTQDVENNWQLSQTLTPPESGVEYFGQSNDIDGTTLILGSRLKNSEASNGRLYLYEKASENEWTNSVTVTIPGTERKLFNISSVDLEGDRIAAGGYNGTGLFDYEYDSSGIVYLFEKNEASEWEVSAVIEPEDTSGGESNFGSSVLLAGEWLFVSSFNTPGSGDVAVSLFRETGTGDWYFVQKIKISDSVLAFPPQMEYFNGDLIIADSMRNIEGNNQVGSVIVYREIETNVWDDVQIIEKIGDYRKYARFGYGMDSWGRYLVVSPLNAFDSTDPVYIHVFFKQPESEWKLYQSLAIDSASYTYFHSLAVNGDSIAITGREPAYRTLLTLTCE